MHVELILEPPMELESFRRTSWTIWSKGQLVALSGRSYRHRATAVAALERVTGGQVQMARETERSRPQPIALFRPDGTIVPIERVV